MRNITQIWLGILLLGVLTNMSNYTVVAQNLSNRGTEFWLGYGNNVLFTSDNPPNAQQMALYFSTTQAATVRVRVNGTSWERVLNIPANSIDASILLPKTGADDCRLTGEGLFSRGVHISSNVPIAAWAHQYGNVLSGGTMLMPVNTFGYSYYSMNYEQEARFNEPTTWFFVVAPEDNTTIEITPSDTTQGGLIPGQTQRINLNRGEIYNVMGKT
ncbi:MAG TPA: hypothetical protein PKD90_18045, partial [Phnomibacter sp.]|nr:hypothetical protein [Phnomibacter sp.]